MLGMQFSHRDSIGFRNVTAQQMGVSDLSSFFSPREWHRIQFSEFGDSFATITSGQTFEDFEVDGFGNRTG